MIEMCIEEFALASLTLNLKKTFWTSSSSTMSDITITIGEDSISWSPHLEFIGAIVDLGGHSGKALHHRLTKATCTMAKWSPIFGCKWLTVNAKLRDYLPAVGSAATWLSSSWSLTKEEERKLASWNARRVSKIRGTRRATGEELGQFWRRLRRIGHRLAKRKNLCLVQSYKQTLHRFAGHAARANEDSVVNKVLKLRDIKWWRYTQLRAKAAKVSAHPKRFNVWRWEEQLSKPYGNDWKQSALDRTAWKAREKTFIDN
jgi:hypothetical protein